MIANLQSQSLEDFPTVKGYSANSLIRKNRRFVSNRLHYIFLRKGFLVDKLENPSNYLIASWGKTSEEHENNFEFHITLYGEMRYLGVAKISKQQNEFLNMVTFATKSSKDKFKKLDALLSEVLSNLHLGGGYIYRRPGFESESQIYS